MTYYYCSKKNHGLITDSLNDLLKSADKLHLPKYNEKYQAQLTDIINKLSCNPLLKAGPYNQTKNDITQLKNELSTHISKLFSSECDAADLHYFQVKFQKSIHAFENSLILVSDTPHKDSLAAVSYNLIEAIYVTVVRPLLMKLLGAIVGVLMSPVLPFSSSARDYVGSFFRTPIGNLLTNEFNGFRRDIEKDAVVNHQLLDGIEANPGALMKLS